MVQESFSQQSPAERSSSSVKHWLQSLVVDGPILMSWLFLFGSAALEAYLLSGRFGKTDTLFNPSEIVLGSAICGYWGWSLYWGVPGAVALARRIRNRLIGCQSSVWVLVLLAVFFVTLFLYPPIGGVLHFLLRWKYAAAHTALRTCRECPHSRTRSIDCSR